MRIFTYRVFRYLMSIYAIYVGVYLQTIKSKRQKKDDELS